MVILELIHAKGPRGWYLLDKTKACGQLVSHDNWADRRALSRRRFKEISALSTLDGRIEAYHGIDG